MVTNANIGFVRLPSLKFVGLRVRKIHRIQCQLSIYNSFPLIRNTVAKNRHFYVPPAFIFCLPWTPPAAITQNVAWMKRQFSACRTPCSMYPSVFNSFPVKLIRTASAKNRRFHVPQPTFLFPLETPLRLLRNMLHGWKDNSMLAKPLAAFPIYIQ